METDQKYSLKDFGAVGDSPPSGTYVRVRDDAMTADQQIRAKALECAVQLSIHKTPEDEQHGFQALVERFETYIREGK